MGGSHDVSDRANYHWAPEPCALLSLSGPGAHSEWPTDVCGLLGQLWRDPDAGAGRHGQPSWSRAPLDAHLGILAPSPRPPFVLATRRMALDSRRCAHRDVV